MRLDLTASVKETWAPGVRGSIARSPTQSYKAGTRHANELKRKGQGCRKVRSRHRAKPKGVSDCFRQLPKISTMATHYPPTKHLHNCAAGRRNLQTRRAFFTLVAAASSATAFPVLADGVQMSERSALGQLVSAEEIEGAASKQYQQLLDEAASQGAKAPDSHPLVRRLRYIANRLIPFATSPNLHATPRAAQWRWEVNVIGSKQINAFCMPGGKIAFFSGILTQLNLTDDEVAMVMGHEMTHALREHSREQLGKTTATNGLIELGSAVLGLGNGSRYLAGIGSQLLSLRFSRTDESEADRGGLDLASRAGYDPRSATTLWQKMESESHGSPPQWLSSHPAGPSRVEQIRVHLPEVLPLFERAEKPRERFDRS